MEIENKREDTRSFWSNCCRNWKSRKPLREDVSDSSSNSRAMEKKPGWKAISYILGNQVVERIATLGMMANFMVYLLQVFNLGQVAASNILGIWIGVSNFTPILGACVADAYLGKFSTIAISSFGTLVGMVILTLTAWLPQLHPPTCTSPEKCVPSTSIQLGILILGLCWLAVGTGGIGPCIIPFSIDQFDTTTTKGRKGVNRFFNWYYTSQTVVQLISLTAIVYLQNKSWILGFGILSVLVLLSIIIFFVGANVYVYIPAEGSIFSGIVQVFVAAYKKHRLQIPVKEEEGVYYDPPMDDQETLRLPLTKELRCLNKAALIQGNEVNSEGCAENPWRLCSIQQVEEVKCLIKMLPIWASGILCFIPIAQQGSFPVSQALKMDRHIGPNFELPAASFSAVSLITIAIFLPCFDLFLQPLLARLTRQEEGLTSLQKILIGDICSILTMLTAGLVEWRRRVVAAAATSRAPMSATWLAPQFVFLGLCEMFTLVGHIQFYSSESPEKMRSVGNSLQYLVIAFSIYVGTLVVNVVHQVTRKRGGVDWLHDDIDAGRLDYYYFLVAGLAALNLVYIVFCVRRYRYKIKVKVEDRHVDTHLDP
ncbi:protein NRT1/ PTR FAMILY 2.13 [Cajanus cajan]|uniref:Peptide transporter PTR1 n=1 Tax=Cajanus cajan TaxID=3821 RepID=A0A151QUF5_CAJCA|nr:protein NRT1/ PTR FAMILY 2.13 [Cajanus cajan]KYP33876.1 Peptide transporter PTR1 [Cajanus cajan]